jgi:hypothetical protein
MMSIVKIGSNNPRPGPVGLANARVVDVCARICANFVRIILQLLKAIFRCLAS